MYLYSEFWLLFTEQLSKINPPNVVNLKGQGEFQTVRDSVAYGFPEPVPDLVKIKIFGNIGFQWQCLAKGRCCEL